MGAVKQKEQTIISAQPQREVRVIHHPHQQPENAKLPVAAYVRVSTDMDDQLNSFAAQLRHYKEHIVRNADWELVDIYADEGISGTSTRRRDEFQRLMRDCRKGKIKRVLVKSISRFARNTEDCIEAVRELTSLGVSVLFEKEGIDTARMTGELFLAAMSDFAQNESLSMAGNLRRGIRMRMANGTYVPTSAPFGYRWKDGMLVIQKNEADTVRWIYNTHLSGIGPSSIADALMKKGIRTKNGGARWHREPVVYILTNERYVGDLLLQKSYASDTLPFKRVDNAGAMDRYLVQNCHTPIIDRETFDRVQLLIEQRKLKKQKGDDTHYPFQMKILCGNCEHHYQRKNSGEKLYWACRQHDQDAALCPSPRIPEVELERIIIRCFNKLKLHKDSILTPMLEQLYALKRRIGLNNPEAVQINEAILTLTEQNAVFAGLAARGIWDTATYQEKKAISDQEIQRLHAERSKICCNDDLDDLIENTRMLLNIIGDGPDRLDTFHPILFCQMVEKIIVQGKGRLVIRLANGLELAESFEKAVR